MNATLEPEPTVTLAEVNARLAEAKRNGDEALAVALLRAARRQIPANLTETLVLGYVNVQLGRLEEALRWFTQATEQRPGLARARSSRALALQLLRRPAEAREEAERALALDPDELTGLKVLARAQLGSGQPEEAAGICRRILERHPGDRDAVAMLREVPAMPAPPPPWEGMFGDFATRTSIWQRLGPEHILQQFVVGLEPRRSVVQPRYPESPRAADGFAVPPAELTMGYGSGDLDRYLQLGRNSYSNLQGWLARQEVTLQAGDAVLDWGCASGRVLRCFGEEARRGCALWGGDVHVPSIEWAKAHLAPPFRFFTCSSLPHLPFADGTFKVIYAFSVLTHLVALRDLWLLELRRVLRPGGCAILTIHDEHTWALFHEKGMPGWMPPELRTTPALPGECVDVQGSTWDQTYTFFHSDYVRRAWGQYFRVAEIIPRADCYQAAVILRHP